MKLKFWKTLLLFGLSLLLISSLAIYPQLELPAPAGPYTVGRTVLRWVDAIRPEVLTDDPNDFREVITMVWYPAAPNTGEMAGYFPNISTMSGALTESGEVSWWQVQGLRWIRSNSKLDAIPLKGSHPYPVVIFSPGNGTNIELYSSLAGEIASHGYLVLGLNHPYDVPAVELSDGRVALYDKEQWSLDPSAHQVYTAERMKVRTADILFVLARLIDMNASGPFAGTLDLDLVAAAGHSLGGIAASQACQVEPRFRACLNYDGLQAGGPFSMDKAATPPAQPFMFLTKESQLHPVLLNRFESMPQSYWVVVHGASHQSFTDGPVLQPTLLPGESQADKLMDLIHIYSLAFLDQTLKGQPAELLGASADEQDISVKVFPSN
jgi:dienelactone hydrolase